MCHQLYWVCTSSELLDHMVTVLNLLRNCQTLFQNGYAREKAIKAQGTASATVCLQKSREATGMEPVNQRWSQRDDGG